jgi:hypothetical protein
MGNRDRTGSTDDTVDPRATSKSRLNLVSLASSGARLILLGIKESTDAFPPLKSTAAALCFILDNYEVRANLRPSSVLRSLPSSQNAVECHKKIETLTPRVQELARLLGGPVPESDDNEAGRRSILEG